MSQQQVVVYSQPNELNKYLQSARETIRAALPEHLKVERMIRLVLTAFSTTPQLRQCTGQSILSSLILAGQMGLEPGVRGQGYLIPYFNNKTNQSICTFIPGWQGLVGLLNNSGRATAWTGAVFEGDSFDLEYGSHPRLVHVPDGPNQGDAAKLQWVYACGQVNGSQQPVIEAWPWHRVLKHRDKFNKVGNRHYSYNHPEMYGRKVVLLQVLKYMPSSIELSNAITAAEAAEMNRIVRPGDGPREGAVITIDPEDDDIPQGSVGTQRPAPDEGETVIEQAAADTQRINPKPVKTEEPKGPSAKDLIKQIQALGSAQNVGQKKIFNTAVALKWVEGEEAALEDLDTETLQAIVDGFDTIMEKIKNP